ncbi:hypothetical protein [Streptomyces sp. NEAU-174]|uniref:hypothetical protein n=1 Tax=Streptomyces sp. NEAU-174 TaxID=3458254 RepID=UPI004043B954
MAPINAAGPVPVAALAFRRALRVFGFARRHARTIMRIGGVMLIVVGILQVTGAWTYFIGQLRYWVAGYQLPLGSHGTARAAGGRQRAAFPAVVAPAQLGARWRPFPGDQGGAERDKGGSDGERCPTCGP